MIEKMRYLLLLVLLLYNIVTNANRPNPYDYDDADGIKRHSFVEERRNWRKKALLKPFDQDQRKDWDDKRYEHNVPRYLDDSEPKNLGLERHQQIDPSTNVNGGQRHYDDDKINMIYKVRSAEIGHSPSFSENDASKKVAFTMTCEKQNERYEPCFAGCAAVTCDNPRERLHPCYPFCEPGCICIQPYVRDDRTHKCVLPEDCTKGLKGIPDLGDDS